MKSVKTSQISLVPGQPYEIVPASWRDLNEVRRLEDQCFKQDAWPLLDLIAVLSWPGMIHYKAVVARDGPKAEVMMAGFAAGEVRIRDRIGWITNIAVLPGYRRLGIGAALLEICEQKLAQPAVRLCVRRSNHSAIGLYLRSGYRQVEVWPNYYPGGEDALVMGKLV